jgi:oligosaccharide repeat unit polymerase
MTSFASALLGNYDVQFDYLNYSKVEISIIPAFLYCFLISICIYPFYIFNSNKRRKIKKIQNEKLFDYIVYFYFFVFVTLLVVFWKDAIFRLSYSDLNELRMMNYSGNLDNVTDNLSGITRVIVGLISKFGECSYFMFFFFFYGVCFLKRSKAFLMMAFLSTLSPVLLGIIGIDRSQTVWWIAILFLCYILFRPYILTESAKKLVKKLAIVALSLTLSYLAIVTISRFGERDTGSSGNFLNYLGQPFINFCLIWDKVWTDDFITNRLLPFTNYVILGNPTTQISDYLQKTYLSSGVHLNVFFSFVGFFLVDLGHVAAVVFPLLMYVIFRQVIPSNKGGYIGFPKLFLVFALGIIIQCGIVTYFYTSLARTMSFVLFLLLVKEIQGNSIVKRR